MMPQAQSHTNDDLDPEIDKLLSDDPCGAYLTTDGVTRRRFHIQIRSWAERSKLDATEIADLVVRKARTAGRSTSVAPSNHVGYYLLGSGARAMEAELNLRYTIPERILRVIHAFPTLTYAALVTLVVTGLATSQGSYAMSHGAAQLTWLVLFLSFPLNYVVASVVARLLLHPLFPRRIPPRMDFSNGIPDACRTLVVIPTILGTVKRAHEMVARLDRLAGASQEANLHFAILSDFPDAPHKSMPNDNDILLAATQSAAELNERHRSGTGARFFVLHRERRWNAAEGTWMGWERKRGKLLELAELLGGSGAATSFLRPAEDGIDLHKIGPFRYLITLDDETWFESGEARELIRVAAHPLNQLSYEAGTGRRLSGYGMFQPAVARAPTQGMTGYAALLLGSLSPLLPKSHREWKRNFYFDVFAEGRYEGRGLHDIDSMRAILVDAIPENALLGHDFPEGFLVGAAYLNDIYLVEPPPPAYFTQAKQIHRWCRGACQWLPWVCPRVRNSRGQWYRNPISLAGRGILAARFLRYLTNVTSLLLLLSAWTILPGSVYVWTAVAMLPFAMNPTLAFAAAVVEIRGAATREKSTRERRSFVRPVALEIARSTLAVVVLAHQAAIAVDALARATWRMLISRRKLLEWTPQHQVESNARRDIHAYWLLFRPSTITGFVSLGLVGWLRPTNLLIAAPFAIFWTGAFLLAWCLDHPLPISQDTSSH